MREEDLSLEASFLKGPVLPLGPGPAGARLLKIDPHSSGLRQVRWGSPPRLPRAVPDPSLLLLLIPGPPAACPALGPAVTPAKIDRRTIQNHLSVGKMPLPFSNGAGDGWGSGPGVRAPEST